ncbi:phosphate/phosphite/phosphonate ABC transporter substrate-binding protein [Variovorax robiniae]|uniref:Phosphate/phosphite/phosphonate ABC transporter substrate-binding protein n=1 Tax=Variovorax robiniae TaxID=1836199 RepID=A0ABU8XA91_9BURK
MAIQKQRACVRMWSCLAEVIRWVLGHGVAARLLVFACAGVVAVHAGAQVNAPLRFGVLPLGDVLESRRNWEPLWAEMAREIGQPIAALSLPSYGALARSIQQDGVDIALLPGKLALDAVVGGHMQVIAEVARRNGIPEHQSVLLTRKVPPFNSLDALLRAPERWVIARGPASSLTGFLVPQMQLFIPNNIEIETRFRDVVIGTHQETALAVANGDADVATNNTTDLERFRRQFPVEAERIQVIWSSASVPAAQILVRKGLAPEVKRKLRSALVDYGRADDVRGAQQRAVLRGLMSSYGYVAADNTALLPVADLEYESARSRALHGQWTSQEALRARLAALEREHRRWVALLQPDNALEEKPKR